MDHRDLLQDSRDLLQDSTEEMILQLALWHSFSSKWPIVEFVLIFKLRCNRVGTFRILDPSLVRIFITVDPLEKQRE